jgi:predicted flap endonuclease-1-like 5' DNA nuclease
VLLSKGNAAFIPQKQSNKEYTMRAFKVFIFGLLYGWFIKIAFDRIYRENEFEDIRNENTSLRDYISSLEMRLQPNPVETKSVQPMMSTAEPTTTPRPGSEAVPVPPGTLGATEQIKDDLKIIKGIGPAIERKLNNAGIFTYAGLAKLSSKDLENILGGQVKRLQDENDLIAQAKRLARRR